MFIRTRTKHLVITVLASICVTVFCLAASPVAYSQAVPGYCNAPYKINWPAASPVWSLCWTPPNSSSGIDGSGLELRHVFYKGKRVFWQAHVPVLNVIYDQPSGPCGPTYRDWQNQLVPFEANNVIQPGYAEPTVPPKTVCDHPGTDAGTFAGVAAEKLSDRLILTTQMQAGWYRYIMKWTFYLDGTIEPRFGFTAVNYQCTTMHHTHHVYWRFDFDVEGFPNDRIDQRAFRVWGNRPLEFNANNGLLRSWRVMDNVTGRGYSVIPGSGDGVADAWAVADLWGLRYHYNEIDDGGAVGGPNGNAAQMNKYLTGENINGQDVVVWYHAQVRHAGGISCFLAGPTLKPIGAW
jgi:hypothetical protein